MRFIDHPVFKKDIAWLLKNDAVFKASGLKAKDVADYTLKPCSFESLIRTILGQQVSVAAARSMAAKFAALYKAPLTPQKFDKLRDEQLRSAGFSKQKIGYARGLSAALSAKTFPLDKLDGMEEAEVEAAIVALKGFGVWTAQMVMMFNLGKRNVWPAGDLGIQTGLQLYLNAKTRPDHKKTEKAGKLFEGRKTAAAILLWGLKGREALKPAVDNPRKKPV